MSSFHFWIIKFRTCFNWSLIRLQRQQERPLLFIVKSSMQYSSPCIFLAIKEPQIYIFMYIYITWNKEMKHLERCFVSQRRRAYRKRRLGDYEIGKVSVCAASPCPAAIKGSPASAGQQTDLICHHIIFPHHFNFKVFGISRRRGWKLTFILTDHQPRSFCSRGDGDQSPNSNVPKSLLLLHPPIHSTSTNNIKMFFNRYFRPKCASKRLHWHWCQC